MFKTFCDATVVVAPVHELDGFGLEELAGKIVVTSTVNDRRLAQFKAKGVHTVIDGAPMLFGHVLDPSLLDALRDCVVKAEAELLQLAHLPDGHHTLEARAVHVSAGPDASPSTGSPT